MFLGPGDTSDLISMVSFTFTMRRHLIRLASAPFTSTRLAKLGWVLFAVCNAWQRSRTQKLRRVGENQSYILTRLWTKVNDILDDVWDSSYFATPLPDCLVCHVSFRRFSILSLVVVRNRTIVKVFVAPNFWEGRPRLFYGRLLARFTVNRSAKFGWVPFGDLRMQSLAMN